MKPYSANLLAAIVLILMSCWGYLGSETPSMTALIPAIFGVIFLALSGLLKKENKVAAHIVVVLTLVVLISLFKPLSGVLSRDDSMGLIRVSLMMLVCLVALIAYVRSFIAARKQRTS
jgi:cytochrome b